MKPQETTSMIAKLVRADDRLRSQAMFWRKAAFPLVTSSEQLSHGHTEEKFEPCDIYWFNAYTKVSGGGLVLSFFFWWNNGGRKAAIDYYKGIPQSSFVQALAEEVESTHNQIQEQKEEWEKKIELEELKKEFIMTSNAMCNLDNAIKTWLKELSAFNDAYDEFFFNAQCCQSSQMCQKNMSRGDWCVQEQRRIEQEYARIHQITLNNPFFLARNIDGQMPSFTEQLMPSFTEHIRITSINGEQSIFIL